MSSMRLGGAENGLLVFFQYPFENTPRTETALRSKYSEFGLSHRTLKGIVEFNIDPNKWIMQKDDVLRDTPDAWYIDLSKPKDPSMLLNSVLYGISLSEPNVNPEFYDQKGQRLK